MKMKIWLVLIALLALFPLCGIVLAQDVAEAAGASEESGVSLEQIVAWTIAGLGFVGTVLGWMGKKKWAGLATIAAKSIETFDKDYKQLVSDLEADGKSDLVPDKGVKEVAAELAEETGLKDVLHGFIKDKIEGLVD
jgi:hypothetical protein